MRVRFFASEKAREQELSAAFLAGVARHGDEATTGECDVAVMVGVKSREIWQDCQAKGIQTVMLDKGYLRHRAEGSRVWEYWRAAVNAHHPTRYLMVRQHPADRMEALALSPMPWRSRGRHIVLAGSSAKYHAFHGLPHPTTYAERLVAALRKRTKREIVYRPKPSWGDAEEVPGVRFSGKDEAIGEVLQGAHALVTHGSNACFEAVLAGVPCVVLGEAVARPISSRMLDSIEHPHLASEKRRRQWLANLAYQQWTLDEFQSGAAWSVIRNELR